jgi:hypothetical protein
MSRLDLFCDRCNGSRFRQEFDLHRGRGYSIILRWRLATIRATPLTAIVRTRA